MNVGKKLKYKIQKKNVTQMRKRTKKKKYKMKKIDKEGIDSQFCSQDLTEKVSPKHNSHHKPESLLPSKMPLTIPLPSLSLSVGDSLELDNKMENSFAVSQNIADNTIFKIRNEFRAIKLELYRATAIYIGYVKHPSCPSKYPSSIQTEEQTQYLLELFNDEHGKYLEDLHHFSNLELKYLASRIKISLHKYGYNFRRFPQQIVPLAGHLITLYRSGETPKIKL